MSDSNSLEINGGRLRGNCGLSLQAHTDIRVLLPGPRAGAPVVLPRQVVDPVDGSDLRLELGSCRDVAVLIPTSGGRNSLYDPRY